MNKFLLALTLTISAGTAPCPVFAQGVGFGSYSSGKSNLAATAPQKAYEPASSAKLKRAAESSFGLGRRRDDIVVAVADRKMKMRIVESRGFTFAVLGEQGIPFSLSGQPNLSAEAQRAAQTHSRCTASGKTWTKRYSNGAFPKYTVHLLCN